MAAAVKLPIYNAIWIWVSVGGGRVLFSWLTIKTHASELETAWMNKEKQVY